MFGFFLFVLVSANNAFMFSARMQQFACKPAFSQKCLCRNKLEMVPGIFSAIQKANVSFIKLKRMHSLLLTLIF